MAHCPSPAGLIGPRHRSHRASAVARASGERRARAGTSGPPAPGVAPALAATAQRAAREVGSARVPALASAASRNTWRASADGGAKYAKSAESRKKPGGAAAAFRSASPRSTHRTLPCCSNCSAMTRDTPLAWATASTAAAEGAPIRTSAAAAASADDCASGPYLASSGCSSATRKAAKPGAKAAGSIRDAAVMSTCTSLQLTAAAAKSERWRTSSSFRPAMATGTASSSALALRPFSPKATDGRARPRVAANTASCSRATSAGTGRPPGPQH
mmetsp:Transcript_86140/g.257064  ORF Transcript_86140/g.257064 Transcript_86140/m.257064 type:complete len:273 (+) Transcript_86140:476-1294(+)